MLTPTHAVTASTIFLAFGGTSPVATMVACGTALAPDFDSRQSIVGRLAPFLSRPIEHHFGHRTVTHSLLLQIVVCSVAYLLLPGQFALAITCGLVSHTVLDMLTKSGVCWFWPSRVRCVLPGASKYRFEVGGTGELIFAACMVVVGFGAVHLHKSTAGTGGMIRAAIGDIGAARRQYDEQKGSQAFLLRVTGRDNVTFAEVSGEFPVIASWAATGLLVDESGRGRTVCTGDCDWYPEKAVLVAVADQRTTVRQLSASFVQVPALKAALLPAESVGDVYLSGRVDGRLLDTGTTVQISKKTANLYYARVDELPDSGVLRNVEVTIQVRHEPGVTVPELVLPEVEAVADGIDPRLQRWLE